MSALRSAVVLFTVAICCGSAIGQPQRDNHETVTTAADCHGRGKSECNVEGCVWSPIRGECVKLPPRGRKPEGDDETMGEEDGEERKPHRREGEDRQPEGHRPEEEDRKPHRHGEEDREGRQPEGHRPEGEDRKPHRPEGEDREGRKPEGHRPEGEDRKPEGQRPEGEDRKPHRPEGEDREGRKTEGHRPEGENHKPEGHDLPLHEAFAHCKDITKPSVCEATPGCVVDIVDKKCQALAFDNLPNKDMFTKFMEVNLACSRVAVGQCHENHMCIETEIGCVASPAAVHRVARRHRRRGSDSDSHSDESDDWFSFDDDDDEEVPMWVIIVCSIAAVVALGALSFGVYKYCSKSKATPVQGEPTNQVLAEMVAAKQKEVYEGEPIAQNEPCEKC